MISPEDILEILDNSKKQLIIVEGKNDKKALERFGCENIITIDKPLFKIVEEVEEKNVDEIIILTDLDSYGKKLYKYFYDELNKRGIRVDNKLRQMLSFTNINQIEGLVRFIDRQEEGVKKGIKRCF